MAPLIFTTIISFIELSTFFYNGTHLLIIIPLLLIDHTKHTTSMNMIHTLYCLLCFFITSFIYQHSFIISIAYITCTFLLSVIINAYMQKTFLVRILFYYVTLATYLLIFCSHQYYWPPFIGATLLALYHPRV